MSGANRVAAQSYQRATINGLVVKMFKDGDPNGANEPVAAPTTESVSPSF